MQKYEAQLKKEVLAESITYGPAPEDAYVKAWSVNGEDVKLGVRKR